MAEVLIEGRRLDVAQELDFSFNYSVADIRDPNKRNTDYSKTIKCPSTKNNDALFGHIWSVNVSNPYDPTQANVEVNFNPNKKAQALVIQDGVTVMRGVVQLRSITVVKDRYEYEVVFIGKLKNIFSVLGDKDLNELDFSDLDHNYNAANVEASWTNTTGYVYPMVDYGIRFEYETNGNRIYDIETWRPAVYLHDILDRIFDFAGFTYTSTFLSSSPFRNLVTLFNREEFVLNDTQIEARQVVSESSFDLNIWSAASVEQIGNFQYYVERLEFDASIDPSGQWSNAQDYVQVENLGYYSVTINQDFTVLRNGTDGNTGTITGILRVQKIRNSVITTVDEVPLTLDLPVDVIGESSTVNIQWSTQQALFEVNDFIYAEVAFRVTNVDSVSADQIATQDTGGVFSLNVTENAVFENVIIPMGNFCPDIKMKDVLLGVFKMFNLYVEVDPNDDTNLIIETRDEYYSGGVIRDWTKKLARDRKRTIKPLGLLSGKEYIYRYSEDDDYYNNRYQEARGETYGTRDIEIDNDFINSDTVVELPFSPTPLVNDGNSSRIIPKIYDEDIEDGAKPVDFNMRVLYYAGLLPSTPSWTFRYNNESTLVSKTTYPYAGHWDNPILPSLDLNFGIPEEIFYTGNGYTGAIAVTNANLYNLYYRSHVDEITDKDAKVFTGEFYLDALDIQKLDFRDQILIDNTYWRLNKVNDYNPFKEGLTKVELFKVLDLVPQENETIPTSQAGGSVGIGNTKEKLPVVGKASRSNFSFYPIGKGTVKGRNNRITESANNFRVLGDNNVITDGSDKVTIIGNNNAVLQGARNVVIINSDNQTVTEDNTTIIDGKRMWRYVSTDVDYSANDREFILADSSKAAPNLTVTLPQLAENLWVCVKKVDADVSGVDIDPAARVGLIDGAHSYTLSNQYDSVELYCDGSNWYIRSDK